MSKIKELEEQMILFTELFMTMRKKGETVHKHSEAAGEEVN